MNKVFKVIWNQATQQTVVVSELAQNTGKVSSSTSTVAEQQPSLLKLFYVFGGVSLALLGSPNVDAAYTNGTSGNIGTHRESIAIGAGSGTDLIANAASAQATAVGARSTAGTEAVAFGTSSTAGTFASSIGAHSEASGQQAVAMGYKTRASGSQSTALGSDSLASGASSVAIGGDDLDITANDAAVNTAFTEVTGNSLVAKVYQATTASGSAAVAVGVQSTATGDLSTAFGTKAVASGKVSTALGSAATASGLGSFAGSAGSVASGKTSIAIGAKANANSETSIAIGRDANAQTLTPGTRGTDPAWSPKNGGGLVNGTLGSAVTIGQIAIGQGATTLAGSTLTVDGRASISSGQHAIAIGSHARTTESMDIAIGAGANVERKFTSGPRALHSGYTGVKNGTTYLSSMALGFNANSGGSHGDVIIGSEASSAVNSERAIAQATAIGSRAKVYGDQALAIGADTLALGHSSISIGGDDITLAKTSLDAMATGLNMAAFTIESLRGSASTNHQALFNQPNGAGVERYPNTASIGDASVAVGPASQSLGVASVAMGVNSLTYGTSSVALGTFARSGNKDNPNSVQNTIAIGTQATASNKSAIAIGLGSNVSGSQSIAIGVGHQVSGNNSGAFGDPNIVSGNNSYAFGNDNTVSSANAFVLGNNVTTTTANSVFLGTGSNFTAAATTDAFTSATEATGVTAGLNAVSGAKVNGIEYGGFAGSTAEGVVSVGTATGANGNERRIQGVAAGLISATSTDAINGSQLYTVADKLNKKNYFHVNPNTTASTGGNATNLDYVDGIGGATGGEAIAAGVNATASGRTAVAVGKGATADSLANIAIGEGAQAVTADKNTGEHDGKKDDTKGVNKAIAIGASAKATNAKTIAIGDSANASGLNANAIGSQINVSGKEATGIGVAALVSGEYATGIGQRSTASGRLATAIGSLSNATGEEAVAIGREANSTGSKTVAIGSNTVASGSQTIALGDKAKSLDSHTVAISTEAEANGNQAVAIGKGAKSLGGSSVALGHDAKVAEGKTNSVAIGWNTNVTGGSAVALGRESKSTQDNTVSIGSKANATAISATAIGQNANATQNNAIALGTGANALATSGVAIGKSANSANAYAIALGENATANLDRSVALGSYATVSAAVKTPNHAFNGITYNFAGGNPEAGDVVSVGNADRKRQIQNVAAGQISDTSTDAINGSQLYSVITQSAWELQAGGNKVGDVNFGDKVNFKSTDGSITITPTAEANGVSTLDLQIKRGLGIALDTSGVLSVANTTLAQHADTMRFSTPRRQQNSFVKADDLARHLNNVGFRLSGEPQGGTFDDLTASATEKQLRTGDTLTMIAGPNIKINQVKQGFEFSVEGENVTYAGNKATVPTKDDGSVDDSSVATAKSVAEAINHSGFTLKTSAVTGGEKLTSSGEEVINPADAVEMIAGKNLTVQQGEKGKITYATKDDVTFNSVTANNTTTNNLKVNPNGNVDMGGNKITNVAKGVADTDAVNVSQLNEKLGNSAWNLKVAQGDEAATTVGDGKINGDNNVTFRGKGAVNVAAATGNTATDYAVEIGVETAKVSANNTTGKAVSTDEAGAETTPNSTALATAGDVINAVNNSFWKVGQTDGTTVTKKDDVKAGDSLNFAKGKGTTVTVETTDNNTVTTVTYNADVDGTTIKIDDNGKIAANTGDLNNNAATGEVITPTGGEAKKLVTAGDVAQAINDAGFKVKSAGTKAEGDEAESKVVTMGDELVFEAGKNLTVKRVGNQFTFATASNVVFNSVQFGDNGPKITNDGNNIKVGDKDGNATQITNVTSGLGTNAVTTSPAGSNSTDKLLDLKGTDAKPINTTAVATVGDLQNMGWVVSADKTTGALTTAYKDTVKNANEVKFVGSGLATVSGKTDGDVRTITVDVNAQNTVNDAQLPVVYTKADGTKVVKAVDGKFYPADKVNQDGTVKADATEVPASEVIASLNNGNNSSTAPTSLANVKSNLTPSYNKDSVKIGTDGKPTADTAGTINTSMTAPTAEDVRKMYNNAATVGDVLNAGWNLQENNNAKDFVKAYDTVNFVNGSGTTAKVTMNDNGTVADVSYDVNTTTISQDANTGKAKADPQTGKTGDLFATASSVVDAINKVALKFSGDVKDATAAENTFKRENQDEAKIIGGVKETAKLTDNNIGVVSNGSDTLTVKLAKDIAVDSVTTGNTKVDTNGVTIKDPTAPTDATKTVSLTDKGLNNGGKQITNVASGGNVDTNGANIGDIKRLINSNGGFSITADNADTGIDKTTGDKVETNGLVKFTDSGANNIVTTVKDNEITFGLNKDVTIGNATDGGSVTLGGNDGVKIVSTPNATAGGKPTNTISNLTGNLAEVSGTTTAQPDANKPADLADKKNNAATVGDVLNAGWNLQGNGKAVDTVVHNDTVDFINGKGTTVTVERDANGKNTIKVDSPIEFVNANTNDTSTPSSTAKLTGDAPVQLGNVASGVRKEDGTALTGQELIDAIANAAGDVLNNAVNVGDLQAATNAAKTEVESVDGSVNIEERQGDNGQTIYDLSVNQSGLKASDDKKTVSATKAGNAFATAEEVANAINTAAAAATTEVTSENGSITVTESRGDNGQNIYDLEVTKATLSYDNNGKVVSDKDGDAFATGKNVADMINNATATAKTEVTGSGFAVVTEQKGANGQTIYNVDVAKADAPTFTNGKVDVKPADEDKVMSAGDVANAINNSGFIATASGNTAGTVEEKLIKTGETVTLDAGKNLTVTQDGGKFSFATKDEVQFNSVQLGDDNGPKIEKDAAGNIKVGDKDGKATSITNVKSNLAPVTVADGEQPSANNPDNLADKLNNAATVADVLNAGWNLQDNGTSVDTVTHNDAVNFVNGRGTSVSVKPNEDGTVNNIQVDSALGYVNNDATDTSTPSDTVKLFGKGEKPVQVTNVASGVRKPDGSTLTAKELAEAIQSATGNTLTNAVNIGDLQAATAAAKTEVVSYDESIKVTESVGDNGQTIYDLAVSVDDTTIETDGNGRLRVKTTTLNPETNAENKPTGKIAAPNAEDAEKLVNAGDIANAINNSGWNLAAGTETDSKLIKPSDKVTFKAGSNNLTVKRDGADITYDLARNIDVDTVTAGDTKVDNNGITINNGAAGNPVSLTKNGLNNGGNRITNVAAGRADTDAVNVSQLKGTVNYLDNKINRNNRDLRAGIAGSNAAAGLPQVYIPGKSMVAASAGTFKGEAALAVGYSRASDNGKLILKLQGNTNTRGDVGGSVGIGYQW